jgi:predicted nuclease of predicted toxin-antitoxin system
MPDCLKLYLDQCLRVEVAEVFSAEGYDVVRASEVGQARADDAEILRYAISADRILITLDDHFGNWAVLPLKKHPGVIRLKVNPTTAANAINLLLPFLKRHTQQDFQNQLVILSKKRTRWIRTGSYLA